MTNRGLWRNLETPKQQRALERLSANYRRPAPTGSPDRLDASPVRHAQQAWPNQLLRVHQIVLIEHDYPKTGDPARTSRFSARVPGAGSGGSLLPVNVNYDGTTSAPLSTQNEIDSFAYTADGTYTAVASAGAGDFNGRRRVIYPVPTVGSGAVA